MALALYMDQHVPRAITVGLRLRGVDVLTAFEDGSSTLPDPALLDRASELNRVLFTQDDDLLIEATRRQRENVPFHGVIYAHQLRVPIGICIRDLELIATVGDPEDLVNNFMFLPL
ncbi:MAG: DUF5615 family PIN-like protein [Candidatus Promineifilaceae bacterium]